MLLPLRYGAGVLPLLIALTSIGCSSDTGSASGAQGTAASNSTGGGDGTGPGGGGSVGTAGKDGWGTSTTTTYPTTKPAPSNCVELPAEPVGPSACEWDCSHGFRWGMSGYWTGEGLYQWLDKSYFPKHEQPSFLMLKFLSGDRNWGSGPQEVKAGTTITYGPDAGVESRIETCTLCPILHANVWGDNPSAVYYPVSGSLVIETANAATREYSGHFENVVFKRVGIFGMKYYRDWVASDDCAHLARTDFDTRKSTTKACGGESDCPNENLHVCDTDQGKCAEPQCDSGKNWDGATGTWLDSSRHCPSDKLCELVLDRDDWYYGAHVEHAHSTGRCVRACKADADCGAGFLCEDTSKVLNQASTKVCHRAGHP